jgi:UDP-N-acetylglucosamine 2-epimerase (non-hydrolysing)
LRTGRLDDPFPEEMFRRAIGRVARLHLAPTTRARGALIAEGVDPASIVVTGNSGIDGLLALAPDQAAAEMLIGAGERRNPLMIATVHRRESRGGRLLLIAEGLARTATALGGRMIVPLHPSPDLAPLADRLRGHPGITITAPQPHAVVRGLLDRAALVLTDSGGLLEEAATLGVPTVILRAVSERAEAVDAGRAMFAVEDPDQVVEAARRMLAKGRMAPSTLFGDGRAGDRIAAAVHALDVAALR